MNGVISPNGSDILADNLSTDRFASGNNFAKSTNSCTLCCNVSSTKFHLIPRTLTLFVPLPVKGFTEILFYESSLLIVMGREASPVSSSGATVFSLMLLSLSQSEIILRTWDELQFHLRRLKPPFFVTAFADLYEVE